MARRAYADQGVAALVAERIIMFDHRGSGSSDAPSDDALSSWERWADEARVILDALDSERAVLFGASDGAQTPSFLAASHPMRSRGLVLLNSSARFAGARDYPGDVSEKTARFVLKGWGTEAMADKAMADKAMADVMAIGRF